MIPLLYQQIFYRIRKKTVEKKCSIYQMYKYTNVIERIHTFANGIMVNFHRQTQFKYSRIQKRDNLNSNGYQLPLFLLRSLSPSLIPPLPLSTIVLLHLIVLQLFLTFIVRSILFSFLFSCIFPLFAHLLDVSFVLFFCCCCLFYLIVLLFLLLAQQLQNQFLEFVSFLFESL